MILPAQRIIKSSPIYPIEERQVIRGMSYGLSPAGYDIRVGQSIWLSPIRRFALASSVEYFEMPLDILGVVHDKSTWARRGLAVQNTIIEPGWRGILTIELTLHSFRLLKIRQGDPIAQIIFHRLEEPTDRPYTGKYQDQPNRPVGAILE